MDIYIPSFLSYGKLKPSLRDRQLAAIRFFKVIHILKLSRFSWSAVRFLQITEWIAGKYEP